MKIILSAGHGAGVAHNRGGVCFNEGDNNYKYSLVLKSELEKYEGGTVDLIRKNISDNPPIHTRAKMGKGYDLYLSIHSNAANSTVRGSEVWDSVERPNKTLAKAICDATASLFNHNNRGVKYKEGQKGYNYYGELRFNEAKSSMIVENGFHSNGQDCIFFKGNHKLIAEVQAGAIANHYGLKKKGMINVSRPTIPQQMPIQNNNPSSWAKDAWGWAKQQGLLDGTRPKDYVTREEFAVVLKRMVDKRMI